MPVLKIIRKRNVCEKENVYFKVFRIASFSEQLLPTACEYSMFLPLTKIKNHNMKVIGGEKSV